MLTNSEFALDISVNTIPATAHKIVGFSFTITFDDTKISPVLVDGKPKFDVGNAFQNAQIHVGFLQGSTNTLLVSVVDFDYVGLLGSNPSVLSIYFKAISAGTSTINISEVYYHDEDRSRISAVSASGVSKSVTAV